MTLLDRDVFCTFIFKNTSANCGKGANVYMVHGRTLTLPSPAIAITRERTHNVSMEFILGKA